MKVLEFLWRAGAVLGRGAWLIIRDIHRGLYRRFSARVWWMYLAATVVAILFLKGLLWTVIAYIVVTIVLTLVVWNFLTSPFKGRKKKK